MKVNPQDGEYWISATQLAQWCGVTPQTIYNWIRKGEIMTCRCEYPGIGKSHYRIPWHDSLWNLW